MSDKIIGASRENVSFSAAQTLKLQLLILDQLSSNEANEKNLKFEEIMNFVSEVNK